MARTSFDEFLREVQAQAEAEGPDAIAEFETLRHRFHIGGELFMLRQAKGMSQKELAETTGIHQSEISRIERGAGNPTEDTLARIGRALGAHLSFVPDSDAVAV